MSKGFSIVELLVVSAIIATFSVVLILNFRSSPTSKTARIQTASVVLSDIRRAQSLALSGSRYLDKTVCGYGIYKINNTSYLLYAGVLDGAATKCKDSNHNYQAGIDLVVETKNLINSNMEIRSSPPVRDIFFESPDPKTYINNSPSLSGSTTISIQLKNQQNCAQGTCTDIKVFASGGIDLN